MIIILDQFWISDNGFIIKSLETYSSPFYELMIGVIFEIVFCFTAHVSNANNSNVFYPMKKKHDHIQYYLVIRLIYFVVPSPINTLNQYFNKYI